MDTWFSEMINIANNDDYDSIYPIDELKEEWSNEGEDKVDIERKRIII